jgi:nucleotidyltransferase substrate binding protein (TIGR01987 family)
MTDPGAERRLALTRALDRFGEALARDAAADPIVIDAAIQRFEFSIELFWRVLQAALLRDGIAAASPRAALRAAYAQGWLAEEAVWLAMIEDRNRTSHTYREALAKLVFDRLPGYLAAMRTALALVPTD